MSAAKCETGWGDSLSIRTVLQPRNLHPTPPRVARASTLPLQGRVKGRVKGNVIEKERTDAALAALMTRSSSSCRCPLANSVVDQGGFSSVTWLTSPASGFW